jgi:transposase-like protein
MNEQTTKRERRRYSANDRARWVKRYERSGKRIGQFCAENGLIQSNLSRWVRQLRAQAMPSQHSGSLVEVDIAASPRLSASATAVRVLLPGGVRMEVTSGADALWLAEVLRALQPAEA